MSDIKTRHEYPPIPDRRFDWCAWHDGEEELGHYGWGRTEWEAVTDLHRIDDERADWQLLDACKSGTCGCPQGRCELDEQSEFEP
jgi:hypothetical protein